MEVINILLGLILLFVIDIALSADNAILIASTTKNLEGDEKRIAQLIGGIGAVLMRLIFITLILFIFEKTEGVNFIYIFGGALLIYIAWVISSPNHKGSEGEGVKSKSGSSVIKAVTLIIAGDILMSFDNAIVIAEFTVKITNDTVSQIIIVSLALFASLAVILFFSKKLSSFMKENDWVVYVAGWLLCSVGIEMILTDPLFSGFINEGILVFASSYSLGGLLTFLKWRFLDNRIKKESDEEK